MTTTGKKWFLLLLACGLPAVGLGGYFVYRAGLALSAPAEAALPEPPRVEPADMDPAVLRAIDAARTAVVESPRSADAWGRLGMNLLTHGFSEEAISCLVQAEQLDPHEVRWPYLHATTVLARDPETALARLRRAVEVCGNAPDAPRLTLAELLLQRGRLDEAERHFRGVLEASPDNARAHLGMSRLACAREALADSLWHLDRATGDPHTRKAARLMRAEVLQQLEEFAAAAQELGGAKPLPPDQPWPDPFTEAVAALQTGKQFRLARADQLLANNRVSEAIQVLRPTVQDYPDFGWAWLMLGRALLQAKDPVGAEGALRTAAERAPDTVEAHFYLGVALFQQDRPREAAACFRKAAQLRPSFAEAHYNLGYSLRGQGETAAAVASFRTALACKPNYAEAHANLGELLVQQGQTAEAVVHLRQAVQLDSALVAAKRLLEQVVKPPATPTRP
jgi:tetratricopeptide (TPR) repeat protein